MPGISRTAAQYIDKEHFPGRLLLLFVLVLCITHAEIHTYVRIPVGALCILGLVLPDGPAKVWLWAFIGSLLVFNLYFSFYYSSNHYFLTNGS